HRQPRAKAAQRRVIRHRLFQPHPDETPKTQPVVQRLLQSRVRHLIPLRQQQRLEHHQRPVRRPPFARRIHLRHFALQCAPINQRRDLLQSRVTPVAAHDTLFRKTPLPRFLPPHPHSSSATSALFDHTRPSYATISCSGQSPLGYQRHPRFNR